MSSPSGGAEPARAASSPEQRSSTVPRPLTPLVGRAREVAAVRDLLHDPDVRLVTVTGPAGIGKTRLAVRIAEEVEREQGDAVKFVALAALGEPDLVLPTIAQAFEVWEGGSRPPREQLRHALEGRRTLLVLDNFEHVDAAAPAIAELTTAYAGLKVLVTSRSVLRISGEHEFVLAPLPVPSLRHLPPAGELGAWEGVTLFVQRARAVMPSFALSAQNTAVVAEICARLDGLPLAIELAAARSKVLSPPALLARLTNRLQVLTSGPRDQPLRLQSMRDAVAWSYDLLSPEEQALFRRLSVFAGGFTLDAAEWVVGDGEVAPSSISMPDHPAPITHHPSPITFEGIASLVDKSLLRPIGDGGPAGEPRFGMLETIREYGLEQLERSGEADENRRRHTAWCLAFAAEADAAFYGRDETLWMRRVDAELDNLRTALSWNLEHGNAGIALRLSATFLWFWLMGGWAVEGAGWLERALAAAGDNATPADRARALSALGMIAWGRQEHDRARDLFRTSLAISRAQSDTLAVVRTLSALATTARYRGDLDEMAACASEALALARAADLPTWASNNLVTLGLHAMRRGELNRAGPLLEEGIAICRSAGYTRGLVWSLQVLADLEIQRGGDRRAAEIHRESLVLAWEEYEGWGLFEELATLGMLAGKHGLADDAARLLAAAEALRVDANVVPRAERVAYEQSFADARAVLGDAAYEAASAAGGAMSLEEAVALAASVAETVASQDETPAVAGANYPGGLSAREAEVLTLLAAGLTNGQIAARLYLSPRTVQAHLYAVYRKLDLGTRAEATRFAIEHGLA